MHVITRVAICACVVVLNDFGAGGVLLADTTNYRQAHFKHVQIEFQRTGGFAGLKLATTVDSGELSEEERRKLEVILAESGFFELPASIPASGSPVDRFHYSIKVDADGRRCAVELGENAVPAKLKPLISFLMDRIRHGKH